MIVDLLKQYRFAHRDEKSIQDSIEKILTDAGIVFSREYHFDARNRIDFLVGVIGIEVKIAGSRNEVLRQLKRYAERPEVQQLILVTTCAKHKMPAEIAGKPVTVVRFCTL